MRVMGEITFCGRKFTAQDVELIAWSRGTMRVWGWVTEIARTLCELLAWTRSNVGLKNHESGSRGRVDVARSAPVGRARAAAVQFIAAQLRTGAYRVCGPEMRAARVGHGGTGEPPVARANRTLSLLGVACPSLAICAIG
jgi:hypothetical protein